MTISWTFCLLGMLLLLATVFIFPFFCQVSLDLVVSSDEEASCLASVYASHELSSVPHCFVSHPFEST